MSYNKETYENLILNSVLFNLDKEKQNNAYRRERYELITNLYLYLVAINKSNYEDYGYEITEVASYCIKNFDSSKGIFLNYFCVAWKNEYSHIMGRKKQDEELHGLRISEEDKRMARNYAELVKKGRIETSSSKLYKEVARVMGISEEKAKIIVKIDNIQVAGDYIKNTEDEEFSLVAQIPADISLEKEFEDKETLEEFLRKIEDEYNKLQERQKPILSDMLTIKIMSVMSLEGKVDKYNFINPDIIKEWENTRNIPTQRDIAQKYNRNEASISRTMNSFLNRLKNLK